MSGFAARLERGGLIDRTRSLEFTLDGETYRGHPGDTVASALLAAGVRVLGRSVLLGRPRGALAADATEPNALLHVVAPDPAPLLPATSIPVQDGLVLRTLAGKGILNGGRPLPAHPDHGYLHVDTVLLDLVQGTAVFTIPEGPDGSNGPNGQRKHGEARPVRAELVGEYDHGWVLAVEDRRLWHLRADRVERVSNGHRQNGHVPGAGAGNGAHGAKREVPLLFPGNDRPGVMLASAVRTYLEQFAVRSGRRAVVVTDNDGGEACAQRLAEAGIEVADVVDHRDGRRVTGTLPVGHDTAGQSVDTAGQGVGESAAIAEVAEVAVAGVTVSDGRLLDCDLVAVSGRLPEDLPVLDPHVNPADATETFVDQERDVTVADLAGAVEGGLRSMELIKRHTLLGTGPAQGKLASDLATAVVAELLGERREDVGNTRSRPPAEPVRIDVLAGRQHGPLFDPVRTTPMHEWHARHGAVFEDVGQWKRPRYYAHGSGGVEPMDTAVAHECRAARGSVAMMDASTLGKIELHGPDVGVFLDRLYTNRMSTLKPGKCRYGVLCGADGMVFDDGVVARLPVGDDESDAGSDGIEPDQHYYATTTTGNAAAVLDWMEEWLQTEWTDLRVTATSSTDHWATIALVGPRSAQVLAELAPDLDCDPESFGFMTVRTSDTDPTCTVLGVENCRIFRVSFSGELAYEINVPAWYGLSVWEALIGLGVVPYGTETMHVLRAEKGFPIVGQETDGTVTPQDLNMDWIVSKKKDFVGKRSFARSDTARSDRRRMVGLFPADPSDVLPEGAQLVRGDAPVGYVTSSYPSATLGRSFALAMVSEASEGQHLVAPLAERSVDVTVTSPYFYDPEGRRRDG